MAQCIIHPCVEGAAIDPRNGSDFGGPSAPQCENKIGSWTLFETSGGPLVLDSSTGEVLEAQTAAVSASRARAHMAKRQASAIAEALAGGKIRLGHDDQGEVILLNAEGEELHAAPGEGVFIRMAALLLLESESTYSAVGSKDGRVFGVGGSGYGASMRYAPAYQRRLSRRSRKVARTNLRILRWRLSAVWYDWKEAGKVMPVFWTLTTPTLDPGIVVGVCETKEEERAFMAWELFRKRDIFEDAVFAGFRGFEVTRKVLWNGVVLHHPHFHLLLWARFAMQAKLANEWWDCLRIATLKTYAFELADLYPDPWQLENAVTACLHVQAVNVNPRKGENSISLEDAIQETLKYTTKPDDIACYVPDPDRPGEWIVTGLPQAYLQAGISERSPRVFECLGAARKHWKAPKWCKAKEGVTADLLAEMRGLFVLLAMKEKGAQKRAAWVSSWTSVWVSIGVPHESEMVVIEARLWGCFLAHVRMALWVHVEVTTWAIEFLS